ncbi:LPXTG-motif cell wall-anchored protein [Kibdelosporangium phytohabitans]|uniref:Gram-positive cocci surface proteins LPxTG domain-containing protein n=1 Tax=Kibdelosporangium phytohabitans TaxID=860235 RepID=A0A0N7F4G7_9PSEU|nr:hypothetical protein AOZ06_34965 [Kibdelosporangium phytohabitans]MBE1462707.1 LPXTG-motif cell wall-anchored protein [Kibdelosporangium phytohabitans]
MITDLDVQANPNGVATGLHQYPFTANKYTSDTKFGTSSGGAITFDEVTVTLGVACSSLPAASAQQGGSGGGGGGSGSRDDLVPALSFRPELANTGKVPFGLLATGVLLLLSGAGMVYFGRRVRRS